MAPANPYRESRQIAYRGGYKYQLAVTVWFYLPELTGKVAPFEREYFGFTADGWLWIKEGYAWDGPSGPTVDTPDFMRGSLGHDVLYQMMREGLMDISLRHVADDFLERVCLEDGMSEVRAWIDHIGLRIAGESASEPSAEHLIIYAPNNVGPV